METIVKRVRVFFSAIVIRGGMYCHKGMDTIVKRSYYLLPIFPRMGKTDWGIGNMVGDNRVLDRNDPFKKQMIEITN